MNLEFLAEMAWKSALISGGALAIVTLLRSRSPEERAAVLRTAVALILALPVLKLLLPALEVVMMAAPEAAPVPAYLPAEALAPAAGSASPVIAADPVVRDDPAPLILLAWFAGAAMVGFRLVAGLWTLRRWTRSASEVECPHWRSAFDSVGGNAPAARGARLLVGDVPSPLGWGWLRPVILIDSDTIRDPDEAEAVLAHELAHVERRDWLVLILARVAVAIFWFNPLMWLIERHLVEEGEAAADARALTRVEPARYAQTLLSCARSHPALPATAIADSGLARRVKAVLEGRVGESVNPRRARLAMLLCVLFAAPVAALKPVAAAPEPPEAPAALAAPAALPAPAALAAPAAPAALPGVPLPLAAPLAPLAPGAPLPPVAPRAAPAPVALAMLHNPTPRARRDRDDDDEIWTEEDSAELRREIDEAMAEARAGIDEATLEANRETSRATREAMREAARATREATREAVREATREAARASRDAGRASRDAARHARAATAEVRRNAPRIAAEARMAARRGMAAGAAGMAQGARNMERGARQMEEEAQRLTSPEYRASKIAEEARRGHTVTDRELLDAIPKLREGAVSMRRGAEDMRRQAENMRNQNID